MAEDTNKPFYQNIVEKKSSRSGKRAGSSKGASSKKKSPGQKSDLNSFADKSVRGADRPQRSADSARFTDRSNRGEDSRSSGRSFSRREVGRVPNSARRFDTRTDAPRTPNPKRRPYTAPTLGSPVFGELSKETIKLLNEFPEIVQSVLPLDSKKMHGLPFAIKELSHELTDERGERRLGYMNDPAKLSAYIRYFQWWNLVRLCNLFTSMEFNLEDGDAAVDLGSGPLTLPIALWMARPDLRAKKLTWYCVDISQKALRVGEELFLSLAAKTGTEAWELITIKGEFGTTLRRRVSLVTSANMFNEIFWDIEQPIESQAKSHAHTLMSYADKNAAVLVIEPGIPRAGRFISLMREQLLKRGFAVQSPCPHAQNCPFPGLPARGRTSSAKSKWCHFILDTSRAPKSLHTLSDSANLPKERASLSFIYGTRGREELAVEQETEQNSSLQVVQKLQSDLYTLRIRILSEPIRLPNYFTGRYACSDIGMLLVKGTYGAGDFLQDCAFGSLLEIPRPDIKSLEIDQKSGALEIIL